MPERITQQLILVLEAFLSDIDRDWFGFDLMEKTGLKSGTVYPLLHGLKEDGWLSATKEKIDPKIEGRPRRRLYRLTGLGEREAAVVVERRTTDNARHSAGIPRLRPRGASI
jgi:PadR family transcriptional regulator, regulatory protein PadR